MMEVQQQLGPSKYLERVTFKWTVANFGFSHECSYSLRSSTFELHDAAPSTWYFGLEWRPTTPYPNNLRIHLVRKLCSKYPFAKIRGSVQFGIYHNCMMHWHPIIFKKELDKNGKGGSVAHINSLLNFKKAGSSFKLICDLILYRPSSPDRILYRSTSPDGLLRFNPATVLNFSTDRDSPEHSQEVKLIMLDGEIVTTKGICYRSPVLRKWIQESQTGEIKLQDYNIYESKRTMVRLIIYLYSNRFDFHNSAFFDGKLSRLAKMLQIKELSALLTGKIINLKTEAKGGVSVFAWRIGSFFPAKLKKIESREICAEDLKWQILLYQTKDDSIAVFVKILEGSPRYHINVKITAAKRSDSRSEHCFIAFGSYAERSFFGTRIFVQKSLNGEYDFKFFPNGEFIINCHLTYSDINYRNRITRTRQVEVTTITDAKPEEKPKYEPKKDLIIKSEGKDFLADKTVLKQRSATVANLLKNYLPDEKVSLNFTRYSERMISTVLEYIYAQKLETETPYASIRMFDFALKNKVELLREVCIDYILSSLEPNTTILIMKHIIEKNVPKYETLKRDILTYLYYERGYIVMSQQWQNFLAENSFLENNIREILGFKYQFLMNLYKNLFHNCILY